MIQGCDVIPIASKSDHFLVRLQMKSFSLHVLGLGVRLLGLHGKTPLLLLVFAPHLPLDPPSSLSDWQSQ
eukprot:1455812-Amphidinium_carterae.1